jgi:NAD(P)H dehydrogenase (quinone)
MPIVSIVYHSGTGSTAKLAEAVARGAREIPGTQVQMLVIEGRDIVEGRYRNEELIAKLDSSDAIIFGSPTYMGDVSGQFKCFADATAPRWFTRAWADKIAGGFTVSAHLMGDKDHTINTLHVFAMQHAMIWVGISEVPELNNGVNRLSIPRGAVGVSPLDPAAGGLQSEDLPTGEALGRHIAKVTARWMAGKPA